MGKISGVPILDYLRDPFNNLQKGRKQMRKSTIQGKGVGI